MRQIALLATLGFSLTAPAAELPACASHTATSGTQQTALLELYTSEGCNSCPPAENWVNGLKATGFSAAQVVPIAFHVDYWDYLGWKDRFSQAEFTQRQQARVAQTHGRFVYTPELMLNGKEWRGDSGTFKTALSASPAADATLQARVDPLATGVRVTLTASRKTIRAGDALYLALVEDGLTSRVAAGENAGATLQHDAVVRKLLGPFYFANKAEQTQSIDIPFAPDQRPQRSSVAIWLEEGHTGRVMQALSVSCS